MNGSLANISKTLWPCRFWTQRFYFIFMTKLYKSYHLYLFSSRNIIGIMWPAAIHGKFFWRILNWKKKQYVTICVRKEVGVSMHFIFPSFDCELYHHLSYQNRDHYNSCSFVYKKSASKIRKIFAKLREFEVLIVWHQFMFTDVV